MYWASIDPELLNSRRNPFVRKVQPLLALADQLRLFQEEQPDADQHIMKAREGSFTQKIEKL
jgi:hypothetical protein